MEILLDTNTLYYLCGISQGKCNLEKIQMKIRNSECIYVSSVTIYEMLNKYKNEVDTLRIILNYMSLNQIEIIQDEYLPLDAIDSLYFKNITKSDLKKLNKKYMPIKIKFETKLTSAILTEIFVVYSAMLIYKNKTSPILDVYYNFIIPICELVRDIGSEYFYEGYENGYRSVDCEDYIRKLMYSILEYVISEYTPIVLEGLKATSKHDFETLAKKCDYEDLKLKTKQLRKKINKKVTSMEHIKLFVREYEKQMDNTTFSMDLDKINTNLFNSSLFGYGLQNYLKEIVHNCIVGGCAFRKNDLADALIVNQINSNRFLITFDVKMKEFLEAHRDINGINKSWKISQNCLLFNAKLQI